MKAFSILNIVEQEGVMHKPRLAGEAITDTDTSQLCHLSSIAFYFLWGKKEKKENCSVRRYC